MFGMRFDVSELHLGSILKQFVMHLLHFKNILNAFGTHLGRIWDAFVAFHMHLGCILDAFGMIGVAYEENLAFSSGFANQQMIISTVCSAHPKWIRVSMRTNIHPPAA